MFYFFGKALKFSIMKEKMKCIMKMVVFPVVVFNIGLFVLNIYDFVLNVPIPSDPNDEAHLTAEEKCLFRSTITKMAFAVFVSSVCIFLTFKVI